MVAVFQVSDAKGVVHRGFKEGDDSCRPAASFSNAAFVQTIHNYDT